MNAIDQQNAPLFEGGGARYAVGIVALALAAGLPTIGGGFVGGDDHQLALNHVLVNHPSLAHAVQLFTIAHRDLYQPLPLLSFSAEFAVANTLGLFRDGTAQSGAWLFHLDNVLLHAVNTLLVWAVILNLHRHRGGSVALIAAVLFAIHPLQAEVVAWLNGRMMLLSTLFSLAAVLGFARWHDRGSSRWAILTVLFTLLSAISKIRVGLPVLLLIVMLTRRKAVNRRSWLIWTVCVGVTFALTAVNVWTTWESQMLAGGAEHLHGPKLVRVLLALAHYFEHLAWPAGLASWYPAGKFVSWADPSTFRAIAVVLPVFGVLAYSCFRSRTARLGALWFLATIASTLPFFPARNTLAADRYLYLPVIGLFWIIAHFATAARWHVLTGAPSRGRRVCGGLLGAGLVVALVGASWHAGSFYATPLARAQRVADLFPDTSGVWSRVASARYHLGRNALDRGRHDEATMQFNKAIETARRELNGESLGIQSNASQWIGLSYLRLGDTDKAIGTLRRAVQLDPTNIMAKHRLASAYVELGADELARPLFEAAIQQAPSHNPTIKKLAALYRRADRADDARALYEQVLANNVYDPPATLALAELDIESGSLDRLESARKRLSELLDWMPKNVDARVALGVVLHELGRDADAITEYRRTLVSNPRAVTAAINLAMLYEAAGANSLAIELLDTAVATGLLTADTASAAHDAYVRLGRLDRCVLLWREQSILRQDDLSLQLMYAWACAIAGGSEEAAAVLQALPQTTTGNPIALTVRAHLALDTARYEDAARSTESLCASGPAGLVMRRRLLGTLQARAQLEPDEPWIYLLSAMLLHADGKPDLARIAVDLFSQRCSTPPCRMWAESIRSRLDR